MKALKIHQSQVLLLNVVHFEIHHIPKLFLVIWITDLDRFIQILEGKVNRRPLFDT